jgi:phenylpropionate dioxygenase-like ring-hydroxylating dioxygenase large terminal subunit
MTVSPKLGRLEPYSSRLRLLPYVGEAWLPVCRSSDVRPGRVRAERFAWYRLALFRDERGEVRAVEDRCPHRGVPLSLGECVQGRLVCAYHGLTLDGDGRFGNLCVRTFAAREHLGMVWVYAGEPASAAKALLPDFHPFGSRETVDTILGLEMRTHWSLVLDNGVDLTHDHLHRKQPFFFKVLSLCGVTEKDGHIEVAYHARLRNEFNRRREGPIRIRISGHLVRLDFDGQPVVHSVMTPRSANGRENTQWWFVSFRPVWGLRPFYRLMLPHIRRVMLAAFGEDRLMLEHEAEAVFDRGAPQTERNPIVREVEALFRNRVVALCRSRLPSLPVQELPARDVLAQVGRGELAVFDPEDPSPLTHDELARRCAGAPTVRLHRQWAHALLSR